MTQLASETESRIPPVKKPRARAVSFEVNRDSNASVRKFAGTTVAEHSPVHPLVKADAEARETELVLAAQAGAGEAFAELQRLHWRRLYRKVISITKNREDTEDVLQDTFLRAYLALGQFEGRSKFSSWITRIAINSALMSIRKRHARPEILLEQLFESEDDGISFDIRDCGMNPEQICDQHQRCLGMLRAMDRLDPKLQAPMRIRTLRECSIKEIAQILDVSHAAAKTRLHRARLRLRRSLELADSRRRLSPKTRDKTDRSLDENSDFWIAVLNIID